MYEYVRYRMYENEKMYKKKKKRNGGKTDRNMSLDIYINQLFYVKVANKKYMTHSFAI